MAKVGRPRTLETPEDLLDLWHEYVEEVKSNPEVFIKEIPKGVVREEVSKPLTKQGFIAFGYRKLGRHISQYLDNSGGIYDEFISVVSYIRACWEYDQISGTMTGRYKAQTLVARLNGYSDKVDKVPQLQISNIKPIDFFEESGSNSAAKKLGLTPLTFVSTEAAE